MEVKLGKYDLLNKLEIIKAEFYSKIITYDEAKEQAKPLIDEMNERAKKIAKKHNRTFKPVISFAGFMR